MFVYQERFNIDFTAFLWLLKHEFEYICLGTHLSKHNTISAGQIKASHNKVV